MILSRACRPKFHHKEMQDKSAIGRHDKHRGRAIERKRRGLILPPFLPVIRADKASISAAISGNDEALDQALAERSFGAQVASLRDRHRRHPRNGRPLIPPQRGILPSETTVYRWLAEKPIFRPAARARETAAFRKCRGLLTVGS